MIKLREEFCVPIIGSRFSVSKLTADTPRKPKPEKRKKAHEQFPCRYLLYKAARDAGLAVK